MKHSNKFFAVVTVMIAMMFFVTSCGDKKKTEEGASTAQTVKKTYTAAEIQEFYSCDSACVRKLIGDLVNCIGKDSVAKKQCEDDAWKAYRKCFEDCLNK
jgi:hypothetical protein